MQVGDLVQYKYQQKDIGLIVDEGMRVIDEGTIVPTFKVIWVSPSEESMSWDWMREVGLEMVNES
tara:strand:- start:1742 stop:1936 length:195 start_codon:yes stop_codon:yes gene_type:complete